MRVGMWTDPVHHTGCTVVLPPAGTVGGIAVRRSGDLAVGALVAVNALGSVLGEDGRIIAGCRAPEDVPRYPYAARPDSPSNTVIGCIATNARLRKPEACRIADLAHTGIARTVSPVHTSLDGDALFTLATGEVEAGLDLVAELAARAVADAVRAAVRHAHGIPADPRAQRTT